MIKLDTPFKVICIDNKFFENKLEIDKIYEAEVEAIYMPYPSFTYMFRIKNIDFDNKKIYLEIQSIQVYFKKKEYLILFQKMKILYFVSSKIKIVFYLMMMFPEIMREGKVWKILVQ